MSELIKLAIVALKAGIAGKINNNIIKDVVKQGVDLGAEKIEEYILKSQKELGKILSDDNLKAMNISQNKMEYIRAEIIDLIKDVKIDDSVLLECRYDVNKLTEELWNKYKLQKQCSIEYENEIRKTLFLMSNKAIQLAKENEDFVKDSLVQIMNSTNDINNTINILCYKIDEIIENKCQNSEDKIELSIPNRFHEYAQKWYENVFLNDFDEEDEEVGVNIKLKDVYLLPHYTLNGQGIRLYTLEKRLFSCVEGKDLKRRMLLILGQPGMGKSSLITWFVNQYTKKGNIEREILVYKFTDFKIDWKDFRAEQNISQRILNFLHINVEDLNQKILILDGFDEIEVGSNRVEILNQLYNFWGNNRNIQDFTLLITCRENYIDSLEKIHCSYITLQPWNPKQVDTFCNLYQDKTKQYIPDIMKKKLQEKEAVFGIPLILYMVLALDVLIEEESSVVDIYDQIFSLKDGGIYDRCLKRQITIEWDNKHRIADIKQQIHQFSRQISIWMFENKSEEAFIPKEQYERISADISKKIEMKQENFKQDVLIGNYFRVFKHYEGIGTEKLEFVHRSIYEYFVAETIYSSIEKPLIELSDNSQEEFAGNISIYLKEGDISENIGGFLEYKIKKLYNTLGEEKKKVFYQWCESAVVKMLDEGMFYYTKNNIQNYRSIINEEINCFNNLLKVLRSLLNLSNQNYIMENINTRQFRMYIRYCVIGETVLQLNFSKMFLDKIDLSGMNLIKANLSESSLNDVDLSRACLENVKLDKSYLQRADLRQANLTAACLKRVNLTGAYLRGTNLRGADLKQSNLEGADLVGADLRGADLSETNLIKVDLRGAYLKGVNLTKANLKGATLKGTYLIEADLRGANLTRVDLREANLIGADLRGTNLRGADLRKANLIGADLTEVDLKEVNLIGADLTKIKLR